MAIVIFFFVSNGQFIVIQTTWFSIDKMDFLVLKIRRKKKQSFAKMTLVKVGLSFNNYFTLQIQKFRGISGKNIIQTLFSLQSIWILLKELMFSELTRLNWNELKKFSFSLIMIFQNHCYVPISVTDLFLWAL